MPRLSPLDFSPAPLALRWSAQRVAAGGAHRAKHHRTPGPARPWAAAGGAWTGTAQPLLAQQKGCQSPLALQAALEETIPHVDRRTNSSRTPHPRLCRRAGPRSPSTPTYGPVTQRIPLRPCSPISFSFDDEWNAVETGARPLPSRADLSLEQIQRIGAAGGVAALAAKAAVGNVRSFSTKDIRAVPEVSKPCVEAALMTLFRKQRTALLTLTVKISRDKLQDYLKQHDHWPP